MDFGWLKRIFKKKIILNTNTSDISTIDTSFIRVPKLSELSYEDRQLVKQYIKELKYDNYESILKYSDELLDKSNNEIEFFMINLCEIIKDISSVINEVNQENYFKLLLSKEEIKQSIDEFHKIIDEATLRLIALDTYTKKVEILMFSRDRSKLLNEKDRLKTTIKISKMHILATFKALKDQEELLNNMENYINSSKSFDTNNCNPEICKNYIKRLLYEKKLIGNDNCDELKRIIDSCNIINEIKCNSGNMSQLLSNLEYDKLIPILTREKRELRKHAYIHRNDYKAIIDEINELVKKYQTTSSRKWSVDELQKTRSDYFGKVKDYIIFFKNYINDDILTKLKESIFQLNYFYYISKDDRKINYYGEMPLYDKCIMDFGFANQVIRNEIGYNRWDWDSKREEAYYHKLSCDILKKVAIINLPFIDYKNLEARLNKVVKQLMETGELHYLYDIYNNDFDTFDLNLNEYGYNNRIKKHSGIYEHFNSKAYLQKLNRKYFNNNSFCHINYEDDNISLDDIFYLDIFLNNIGWFLNGNNIDELFNDEYGLAQGMNKELFKLMLYSNFKNIDREYDNRIFIIPRQIEFNQVLDYKKLLKSTDELNIKDNNVAIYLSNWGQVNAIHRVLKEEKTHIKYLMMTESLYDSYKEVYGCDLEQKIIRVPNQTRYNALSSYLDQEFVKEQEQSKVLSKIL